MAAWSASCKNRLIRGTLPSSWPRSSWSRGASGGRICALLFNVNRGRHQKAAAATDFITDFTKRFRPLVRRTAAQIRAGFERLTVMMGGTVKHGNDGRNAERSSKG